MIAAVWCYEYLFESRLRRFLELAVVRMSIVIFMLAYMILTVPAEGKPFIYMQF